jgi:uncharacterized protein
LSGAVQGDRSSGSPMRALSPLEARVLGVLVEKQATVPDTYPLSLNALVAGCNQKTARSPVIEASETDVITAIDSLKSLSLVFEGSGSRVVKFEHNMARVLQLPGAAVALLAVLMLRGPQTAAELRLNCERLHRFADISAVEGFLEELAGKAVPLVQRLARAPGEREGRWAQTLTGPAANAAPVAVTASMPVPAAHRPGPVLLPPDAASDTPPPSPTAGLRFTLPADKKLVHTMTMPLRWGDMDAMGHVNNTLYFRYMETIRLDWIFSHGGSTRDAQGPIIVNAFCNFLRQLAYPGDIVVTLFVANPGRSSFDTYHTIERTDEPGVVYAEGGARTVWTDYVAKRSTPIPDWFRVHLS